MSDSISGWIRGLKIGDAESAQKLWERYSQDLLELAQTRLGDAPRTAADEEDVAQSVFSSICRGAAAGRFANIKSRDDLWWLLLTISTRKSMDQVRRERAQKRGFGRIESESGLAEGGRRRGGFALDELVGDMPTPEFLVMLQEQYEWLLALLPNDRLREVAVSRIEGYTVPEIGVRLAIGSRAVERKLQLIRSKWAKELSGLATGS